MDVIVVEDSGDITVVTVGEQGPAGPPGADGSGVNYSRNFSYGDASPDSISTPVPANKLVRSCRIVIETPFNGVGAALKVGDSGNLSRLMGITDNDPATAATYETSPQTLFGGPTQCLITITPGSGATQGTGQVILEIEP